MKKTNERIFAAVVKLSAFLIFLPSLGASCFNRSSVGNAQCIRVARYGGLQWSTCVTDLYIRQKSKGRHGCVGGKANCIYQCMLEVHELNSGVVASPCDCSLTEAQETDNNPTKLPAWCFSPSGAECTWYKTCLNRRYKCDEGFNTDVVAFAEQLCKLYLNAYTQFTSVGDLWINGVRKCLQVSLVPLLRQWQQQNRCDNSTKNAMTSFSSCFVSSFPGIPYICRVPLPDLWGVFWYLRQTLPSNSRKGLKVILGMIENCTRFREVDLSLGKVRKLVFQLTRAASCEQKFQKFHEFDADANDRVVKQIGDEIAKEFFLAKRGILWFAYPLVVNSKQTTEIVLYIADKHAFRFRQDLQPHLNSVANLNNTVDELVRAVQRNTLHFQTFETKQEEYRVLGTVVCRNFECRQNCWNVSAELLRSGCFSFVWQSSSLYSYILALVFVYINI